MKSWLSQMLVDIFVSQNSVFKCMRVCMGGTQGGVCICVLPRGRHLPKNTPYQSKKCRIQWFK